MMKMVGIRKSTKRLVLAACAVGMVFGAASADAAATINTTLTSPASPALGKLVSGSTGSTSYIVTPAGAVSNNGGGGVRVLGNASVTTARLTITCDGKGNGANSCDNYSKVVVSLGGQSSSGGRAGTVTGISGAMVSGSASVSQVTATSFQITPSGGGFTNGQIVTVNIGVTIQFANTGNGLGTATSVSYTLISTPS